MLGSWSAQSAHSDVATYSHNSTMHTMHTMHAMTGFPLNSDQQGGLWSSPLTNFARHRKARTLLTLTKTSKGEKWTGPANLEKYIRMYMNIICRSYTNIRPQIAWKTLENTISALVVARYYFVVSAMLNPHDRNVLFQLHRCHSPNTTISYNR